MSEMNPQEVMYRVFYRDYVNQVSVSSSAPEPLPASRVAALAEALLQHADNFLGVCDAQETILQAYLSDDEQSVLLELLYPESSGVLRLSMSWADAVELLSDLPAEFSDALLPGASYLG